MSVHVCPCRAVLTHFALPQLNCTICVFDSRQLHRRRAAEMRPFLVSSVAARIGGGLAVGRNPGSPITTMYASPFAFTGTIDKVTVSTSPAEHHDHEEATRAEAGVAMARQ